MDFQCARSPWHICICACTVIKTVFHRARLMYSAQCIQLPAHEPCTRLGVPKPASELTRQLQSLLRSCSSPPILLDGALQTRKHTNKTQKRMKGFALSMDAALHAGLLIVAFSRTLRQRVGELLELNCLPEGFLTARVASKVVL